MARAVHGADRGRARSENGREGEGPAKLNVDEHGHVSMEYRILSIPTFILFKGGKVVHTIVGGRGRRELKGRGGKHLDE